MGRESMKRLCVCVFGRCVLVTLVLKRGCRHLPEACEVTGAYWCSYHFLSVWHQQQQFAG